MRNAGYSPGAKREMSPGGQGERGSESYELTDAAATLGKDSAMVSLPCHLVGISVCFTGALLAYL